MRVQQNIPPTPESDWSFTRLHTAATNLIGNGLTSGAHRWWVGLRRAKLRRAHLSVPRRACQHDAGLKWLGCALIDVLLARR